MFQVAHDIYDCPAEALASLLGKKWVATIIWTIQDQQIRFGELERQVKGCTRKMLIQQLDLLMKQEIVINNKETNGNSVESTYYLSEKGMSLLPLVGNMITWGREHLSCGES